MVRSQEVMGAIGALKHDFAPTERHMIFLEGPVTFAPGGHWGIPYASSDGWLADLIGVLPRSEGGAQRVR
ncbi:hypothetical protein [Kitasatospora sp. P5_F3]